MSSRSKSLKPVSLPANFPNAFECLETRQLLSGSVATSAADNSLAYDSHGTLHVAYYDASAHSLKYMSQSAGGTWSAPVTIDSSSPDVGKYVSLAVAPNGHVGIAYYDATKSDLKYADYNGTAWTVWTVDSKKAVGMHPSLAFDSKSSPLITYYREDTKDLKLATFNGKKWQVSVVSSKGDTGLYSSIAIGSDGKAYIAYESDGKIVLSQKTGKKVQKPVDLDTVTGGGTGVTLTIDPSGNPAASFYDPTTGDIKVARKGDGGNFNVAAVANVGVNANPTAQLLFDPATGAPLVVYYDAQQDGLFLAKGDATSGSSYNVVQLKANTGGAAKATLQPNNGSISYTFTDTTGGGGLVLDNTDTTPALPTGIAATANSASRVTVSWTDNSTNETAFLIERSTDNQTFTQVATTAPNTTTYSDAGLSESTVYYYRVSSIGGSGEQSIGGAQNVVSTTTLPGAPSSVTVAVVSSTAMDIAWTSHSAHETGFSLGRSSDGGATWTQLATVGAGITMYSDTGLTEGQSYQYRVSAYNVSGNSDNSAPTAGTTKPGAPTALTAVPASATQINVSWTNHSSNASGIVLERSTDGTTFSVIANLSAGISSYSNSGLASAATYYYRVKAVAGSTSSAYTSVANAVTDANAPSGVTATAISPTRIDISFTDNTTGETGFKLQRSAGGGDFATIATLDPNVTTYSDTGRTEGVSYSYRVKATSNGADSANSATISSTTLPSAPTTLAAALSGNGVALTWTDASTGETAFRLQRSIDNGVTWATVGGAPIAANSTGTTDSTVSEAATYKYRVAALNTAGLSSYSNVATITTLPAAPTGLVATATSATAMSLTWIDNSAGETGFKLQRSPDGTTWSDLASIGSNVTTYSDTSLTAATTYRYRVAAFSGAGTTAYATPASAITRTLAPQNVVATQASATHVDLTWTAVTGATGYQIERAPGSGSSWTLLGSANTASYSDLNAAEGTAYQYRVTATNNGGASVVSASALATTIPLAPSSVVATASGLNQVNLTWSDNSAGETGYDIDRSSDGGTTWLHVTTTSANAVSYSDSSAVEATTYLYRVRSSNAGGSSAWVAAAAASTIPAAPTTLVATGTSATSVSLSWVDNSAGETGYRIERSSDGGTTFAQISTAAANATGATDATVAEGLSYVYRVRAVGAGGFSAYSNGSAVNTIPAAPSGLAISGTQTAQVDLSWTDNSAQETGFRIERSDDGGTTFTPAGTVGANVTTFSDTGVVEGSPYQYRVVATKNMLDSAASAVANASTLPAAPTDLSAVVISATHVDLQWTDHSTHEAGFRIERSADNGSTFTQIDSVGEEVVAYSDLSAVAGAHYQYRVRSYTASQNSTYSNVQATTLLPAAPLNLTPTVVQTTRVELAWGNVAGETGYKVERSDDNGSTWNQIATTTVDQTTYADTTAVETHTYQYRVRATNLTGDGVYSSVATATTFLAQPTGLTASTVSATEIDLGWTDASQAEVSYEIQRSTNGGSTFSALTTVGAGVVSYQDTSVTEGNQYVYRVRAVNVSANSDWSSPTASAITPLVAADTLAATPVSTTRIDLTWADHSGNETGYVISRSDDGGTNYSQAGSVGANISSWSDLTVTEGHAYTYTVRAVNAVAQSPDSGTVSTGTPPAAPSSVAVHANTASSITVTWTDNSAGETAYLIERSDDAGTTWNAPVSQPADTVSWTDSTVSESHAYSYRVTAAGSIVNSASAGPQSATTYPAAPSSFVAASTSATNVHLSWTSNSAGEMGFRIERSANGGTTYSTVTTVSAGVVSYDDATVAAGTAYTYRVLAYNGTGDSAASNLQALVTRPPAVTGFAATPFSATRVDLSWTDVAGETGYTIERSSDGGTTWASAGTPAANATSFSDTGAAGGTTYTYRITPANASGSGVPTSASPVLTVPAAPTPLTVTPVNATRIDLSWTDVVGETGYKVQRSITGGITYSDVTTLGANVTTFSDTGLASGSDYTYRVLAMNATGASAGTATGSTTTVPAAVANLTAAAASPTQINVTWWDGYGETGYTLERSSDGGTTWSTITSPAANATSYNDTGVSEGHTFTYRLTAQNVTGSSLPSTTSATSLAAPATSATATVISATRVDLAWTDNSSGETGYRVYRSSDAGTSFSLLTTTAASAASYSDTAASEGTSYVYRIIAIDAGGASAAADSTAVTLPATPTGFTATPMSATRVDLAWTDNAAHETGYAVQKSTDSGTTWTDLTVLGANATGYSDTSATAGATAAYRVLAVQGTARSAASAQLTRTTVPAAITNLATSVASQTQVNLSWSDTSGETSYRIERSGDAGSTWSTLNSPAANATSFNDTTAVEAHAYQYRIYAVNGTGDSAISNIVSATTLAAAPTAAAATPVSATRIDVTWTDNSSGETGYNIQRSTDGGTTWTNLPDVGASITTYSDTSVAGGSTYRYQVRAVTAGGASAWNGTADVTTIPAAPVSLGVTGVSATQINLVWNDVAGETGYTVQRSDDGGTTWNALTTPAANATSYNDTTAVEGTIAQYRIRASNGTGDSPWTLSDPILTVPAGPTSVAATVVSATRVDVSWNDMSGFEAGYKVERSADAGTTWTTLSAVIAPSTSSYSDTTASPATSYTYRVTAFNDAGSSAAGTDVALTVPAAPASFVATVVDATHVSFTWSDVAGEASYRIERSADGGTTWGSVATPAANATSASDATAAEATAYKYRIIAVDAGAHESAPSAEQTVTTVPATPTGLALTPVSATRVDLAWADHSSGETAYKVSRSDDAGSTWTVIEGNVAPGTNAYSDTSVAGGTAYRYRVFATNGGGDSAASNTVSVTTIPVAPGSAAATATGATTATVTWANVSGETGFELQRSDDSGSTWSSPVALGADVVSYNATGLTEGTSYVYRIRAVNVAGNGAYSPTATVMTLPGAPSTLVATPTTATHVSLTWNDNSHAEDNFVIERSTDSGSTWSVLTSPAANATSYSDVAAAAGTTNMYRIKSVNATGGSAWSNTSSALTIPVAPGSVSATAASAFSVTVTWGDVTGESSYIVKRSDDGGTTWSDAGTPAADATQFTDTGLTEATAYTYKLVAHDATGDSDDSLTASVTTLPAAPSGLVAGSISATSVTLNWTDHSHAETGFRVERSGDGGASWTEINTTAPNVVTYTDSTVTEASSYKYRVRAYNTPGNSNYSSELALDTKPVAPTTLHAVGVSATRVDLDWTDNSSGEAGFRIERSADAGSTWSQVASVGSSVASWSDLTATEGTAYSYRVRAYRGTSTSAYTNEPAVTTVPAAPTSLTATASAATTINLAWTDNSAHETGYTVQRSTDGGSTWSDLATIAASSTSYSDTAAPEAATTSYRVVATNAGASDPSNVSSALTPVAAPTVLAVVASVHNQATLSWTDNSSVETGSKIERSDDGGATWAEIHTVGTNVSTWTDTTVTENSSYRYRVRATDGVQNSAYTNTATVLTPLAAPTALIAVSTTATRVDLNWTDNSSFEANYSIERSDDSGSTWAHVFTVGAGVTTYADTTAAEGTAYVYRVRATKSGNASAYTANDAITTLPAPATGLSALAFSTTEIDLAWTDNSAHETAYEVERSTDNGINWSHLSTQASGTQSYSDTSAVEGHTYNYRVHAIGAGGNAADSTPATGITPPSAPSSLSAAGNSATSVTLTWTDNSNGETGYKVERSSNAGSTWTELTASLPDGTTTYTDNAAVEGTDYVYRVRANRSTANSAYSNTSSITTVPAAPTAQAASVPSTTRVVLNWTDNSNGETGYRIERAANGGSFTLLNTVAANTITYSDNTVGEGQTYVYRVRASNAAGSSLWSADMNAATAPAAPSALAATAVAGQVTLNWTNNSAHQTGFKVERSVNGGSTWVQIDTTAANVTTYADTTVTESATYQYRVRAYNAGTTSASSSSVSTTTPLNTPTSPTAATVSATRVDLTWVDNSTHESSYKVERSTDNATWSVIATPAADSTSYSDTAATEATLYYYRIRAYRTVGASAYTASVTATTLPAAPTGMTATAASDTQINLAWTDHSAGETGFTVERSADAGSTWTVLTSAIAANVTSYSDTTAHESTSYLYRVKATTAGGSSAYATSSSVTALPAAPTSLSATSNATDRANLTWTDNSAVETGYKIERSTDNGSTWGQVSMVGANVTSWSDVTVSEATNYQYRVRATTGGLNSTYTPGQSVVTLPEAPSNLAAATASSTQIDLTWTDNSSGETGVRIERSVDGGTTFTEIHTSAANATSYSDTGVTEGTLYQYRIRATNSAGGFSDYAASAEATTLPAAPSSLAASSQPGAVTLTWHDNSVGELGYKIERSAAGMASWSEIDTVGADEVSYTDLAVTSATGYDYRIRAFNAGGNSSYSATANVTTV